MGALAALSRRTASPCATMLENRSAAGAGTEVLGALAGLAGLYNRDEDEETVSYQFIQDVSHFYPILFQACMLS